MDPEAFIHSKLAEQEEKHRLEVLFAVERSSRLWGTDHKGSDWDVHFVYRHPLRRYCAVNKPNPIVKQDYGPRGDSKDKASELDVQLVGMEFSHFAGLIAASDPTIFDVVFSTIVYRDHPILEELRESASSYFDWKQLACHYCSWGSRHLHLLTIKNPKAKIRKKEAKMFAFTLRGLLSCEWLVESKGTGLSELPLRVDTLISTRIKDRQQRQAAEKLVERLRNGVTGPFESVTDTEHKQRLYQLSFSIATRVRGRVVAEKVGKPYSPENRIIDKLEPLENTSAERTRRLDDLCYKAIMWNSSPDNEAKMTTCQHGVACAVS